MQSEARHLGDVDLVGIASHYESARLLRPISGPLNPAALGGFPFDRDQVHYGLAWQIPLFTGGALLASDRAATHSEAAAVSSAAHTESETRYNVRATFRNALALQHALAAAGANEQALEQDLANARLRVKTEASPPADADKVAYALAATHGRRAVLAAQDASARALLAALMGEDGAVAYELGDLPREPAAALPGGTALAAGTEEQRRDLTALRESRLAQQNRADAVRAGFLPQVALTGSWLRNDGPSSHAVETFEATVTLKIPLLADIGRTFAVREAEAAQEAARARERARELEIEAQARDAVGRVEAARAALEAGKAQRALGAELARVEKLKLDSGAGKVEDYLAARTQELEGETGYWQSLYGLQTALDYVAFVSGTGGSQP